MQLSNARTGLAAVTLVIVGPLLAYFGVLPPIFGFWMFAAGGLLAIITLIFGVIATARKGFAVGGGNLVIGAIVTVAFLANALPGRGFPRINDITTNTANPPQFVAIAKLPENAGRDLSYPGESFAEQQRAGYPDLKGLSLSTPPDQVFALAQTVLGEMPDWKVIEADPGRRTIEAVVTSRLFRFQDDFVIEVHEAPGGSLVEMRSKSHVGKGDVGANAARIQAVSDKLSQK